MAKESKRNSRSKEDEPTLLDERIHRLQEARPKAKGTQLFPSIGTNSNEESQRKMGLLSSADRQLYDNEAWSSKSKGSQETRQDLISVHNVSLVTARQGTKKLPYGRTRSNPLPQRSSSRMFPPISPSRKTPHSAPAQMLSNFQWPSIPEQRNSEVKHVPSESAQNSLLRITNKKKTEVVRFPFIKPQPHDARKSTQASLKQLKVQSRNCTNDKGFKEQDKRHEDEISNRPSDLEDCKGARLLERPKVEDSRLHAVSSPSSRILGAKNASAGKVKGQGIYTVKKAMHDNGTSSCPQRSGVKSEERNIRQHKALSHMQQGNPKEVKPAMIIGEREDVLDNGEVNDSVLLGDEEMQKYYAPKQKRRDRLLARADSSNGHRTLSREQVLRSRLEEKEFEEVFVPPGSRAPEVASLPLQKTTNLPGTAARKEKKQSNDDTVSISCTVTVIPETESIQDKSNVIGQQNTSPVSKFVSQLIADSQNLTLNDSIESPSLQERKKVARNLRKKFG